MSGLFFDARERYSDFFAARDDSGWRVSQWRLCSSEHRMSMCFFLPEGSKEVCFVSDGLVEMKILFHQL